VSAHQDLLGPVNLTAGVLGGWREVDPLWAHAKNCRILPYIEKRPFWQHTCTAMILDVHYYFGQELAQN
jgi:hypothetical protein